MSRPIGQARGIHILTMTSSGFPEREASGRRCGEDTQLRAPTVRVSVYCEDKKLREPRRSRRGPVSRPASWWGDRETDSGTGGELSWRIWPDV